MPQCSKSLRLIQPFAPRSMQYRNLSLLETTATAVAPNALTIWIAIEPRPPAPPHTRTTSSFFTRLGDQPSSIRYAVAPTSMYAAEASQVRCLGRGQHWCACTLVNCAKLPQFDS